MHITGRNSAEHRSVLLPLRTMTIQEEAQAISDQFEVSPAQVKESVREFRRLMKLGLEETGHAMTMIPSYVTHVPKGSEKGTYLAIDLGGTNIRVCSVTLDGEKGFKIEQEKAAVSRELMTTDDPSKLFHFIATRIKKFVVEKLDAKGEYKLGFTFSFPVNQTGPAEGTLLRWTKGFDIPAAVGQDVCGMLQTELDKMGVKVRVAALVNDTVGTLMARSYVSNGNGSLVGAIYGTGTNGAYLEKMTNIKKLGNEAQHENMVINTEWGSFDNALTTIGNTPFDVALDKLTPNPGNQMFEKRVSGMFLGELLRQCLLTLSTNAPGLGGAGLFSGQTLTQLNQPWSLDTSVLSMVEGDNAEDMAVTSTIIQKELGLTTSVPERGAIKQIVRAIGRRAARLAAVPMAAIVSSSAAERTDVSFDIGVDGSVVEYYPNFIAMMRESLRDALDRRAEEVNIEIATDGSGVGAALCALVA